MHEMYEIDDLKSFDDAMGDINSSMPNLLAPRPSSPSSSSSTSSSDSLNWLKHTPFESGSGSSSDGGGMRRCTSMAVLPSDAERQKKTFSLLALMTETDDEVEDDLDTSIMHDLPKATGKLFLDESSRGGTVGSSSSSSNGAIRSSSPPCPPGEEDVTNSANRRPSRRSQGGPLKSSLKRSTTSTASSTTLASVQSGEEEVSSNANAMKRNVSFSSLEIRAYNITLGNTPTLNGAPISLDWEYDPSETVNIDIDSYEQYRCVTPDNPDPQNPRRSKGELYMLPSHRQYLLMRECGYSRMQIENAIQEARYDVRQREKSAKKMMMGTKGKRLMRRLSLDEMLEKATTRLSASFRPRRRRASM